MTDDTTRRRVLLNAAGIGTVLVAGCTDIGSTGSGGDDGSMNDDGSMDDTDSMNDDSTNDTDSMNDEG